VRLASCGVCLFVLQVLVSASDDVPAARLRNFSSPAARFWIEQGVAGAIRRLDDPECRQVFADFADGSGRALADNLGALGVGPRQYLTTWVWFVEASQEPQCDEKYGRTAYTAPGSRVIFICGSRLVKPTSTGGSAERDVVVIHELLHSLGLGENPPTSRQITKQVIARCVR
jgi:hypothetical protein